jgi:hypothetical protein
LADRNGLPGRSHCRPLLLLILLLSRLLLSFHRRCLRICPRARTIVRFPSFVSLGCPQVSVFFFGHPIFSVPPGRGGRCGESRPFLFFLFSFQMCTSVRSAAWPSPTIYRFSAFSPDASCGLAASQTTQWHLCLANVLDTPSDCRPCLESHRRVWFFQAGEIRQFLLLCPPVFDLMPFRQEHAIIAPRQRLRNRCRTRLTISVPSCVIFGEFTAI